jgi:hypothetical protein
MARQERASMRKRNLYSITKVLHKSSIHLLKLLKTFNFNPFLFRMEALSCRAVLD